MNVGGVEVLERRRGGRGHLWRDRITADIAGGIEHRGHQFPDGSAVPRVPPRLVDQVQRGHPDLVRSGRGGQLQCDRTYPGRLRLREAGTCQRQRGGKGGNPTPQRLDTNGRARSIGFGQRASPRAGYGRLVRAIRHLGRTGCLSDEGRRR
jgi:hypothetical protein